ncbi:MAG: tRNA (adenosine(37)-N6)-threonylcarbamoyltransferase complex dimerization subunit type 1 TsaB, partial [Gammaproteobacteria bacterium]|nr:tRNA (adenosine(37)-N6)-threonylcarbamoyltransferase complex dimerization subunit type 1 TsaB [Gammaproteobacteria bacterium]
ELVALDRERVAPPEAVRLPPGCASGDSVAIGRGFAVYAARFSAHLPGPWCALLNDALPSAREIALLGLADWQAGRQRPPTEALPVYLRNQVAGPAAS